MTGESIKMSKAGNLPATYEKRYKSRYLKDKIADNGMWALIPCVNYPMNSREGSRRIKQNSALFDFIDKYFPDGPFAFEPNMMDGRFMFLPDNVSHQGIGICASVDFPGALEVGQFWYPCEFTEKTIPFGPSQVYVSMYTVMPMTVDDIVGMVREIYIDIDQSKDGHYCTFPFLPGLYVTLDGDFMDDLDGTVRKIRSALKGTDAKVKRNGEGLIGFMERIMSE